MKYFFLETRDAGKQFSELFDFAWAAAPALWNLRWQVGGFLQVVPKATPREIVDRFVFGSGIHGANLRRSCIDTSWEEQKSQFASIILTNAFSIYEYWAESILLKFTDHNFTGKSLQFDGRDNFHDVISVLCAEESDVLKNSFYPIYSGSRKYALDIMPNLLKCYRYFKEARNSQIHSGGKASQRAAQAYADFKPVSDRRSLDVRKPLIHDAFLQGQPIKLHLRGVVGFCDILLRMMTTVDAELCRSVQSEVLLEDRLRGVKAQPHTLSGRSRRREEQVLQRCAAAQLPAPKNVEAVYNFMRAKRIISI